MEILLKELTEKMEKSVNALKNAFNKIRTGRANPAILDDINVDYYAVSYTHLTLPTIAGV